MGDLDRAITFEEGMEIGLDGQSTAVFSGNLDPSANNEVAPPGSLYLRNTGGGVGEVWYKTGTASNAWVKIGALPAHKDTHKSGGSDAFLSTDLLEAVVKRLRETSGPTDLTVAGIADGFLLQRVGSTIVGVNPSGVGPSRDIKNATITLPAATSSTAYVDMPGATFTTAAGATRDYLIVFSGSFELSPSNKTVLAILSIGGAQVPITERELKASSSGAPNTLSTNYAVSIPGGTVVKMLWKTGGSGTATAKFGTLSAIGAE